MTGVATAAVVGSSLVNAYSTGKASDAAGKAADAQLAGEQRGLDYQMERERIPTMYRDAALSQLGNFYGVSANNQDYLQSQYDTALGAYEDAQANYDSTVSGRSRRARRGIDKELRPGLLMAQHEMEQAQRALSAAPQDGSGQSGQMGLIDDVQQSPFYQSMLTQGDEAVARNATMTGGLRSGNANEAFVQNSQNVLHGLVNERVGGLQGLAGTPLNTNAIAGGMAGIGQTRGQGIQAQGQIEQQGIQNLTGLIGMGTQAYMNRPQQPPLQPNDPYGYGATGGVNSNPYDYTGYV